MATGIYKRTIEHSQSISLGLKKAHEEKKWGFQQGHIPITKTNIYKNCALCGLKIKVKPCRLERTKFCSRKCKELFSVGKATWNKGLSNYWAIGEKNVNWKGGTTSVHDRIRKSIEYEEWRTKVFERDNYTCRWCDEVGGILHADHIKPFALYPEFRLDINNGRTLCIDCHKTTRSYLNPYMKREDFLNGIS